MYLHVFVIGTDCIHTLQLRVSCDGIVGYLYILQDTRPKCSEDSDYQTSTTTMHTYWDIPNIYISYLLESFVKIEERLVDGRNLAFIYKICYYVSRS
jgi:hypothetical protein